MLFPFVAPTWPYRTREHNFAFVIAFKNATPRKYDGQGDQSENFGGFGHVISRLRHVVSQIGVVVVWNRGASIRMVGSPATLRNRICCILVISVCNSAIVMSSGVVSDFSIATLPCSGCALRTIRSRAHARLYATWFVVAFDPIR
jgi:hypothetical protein